MNIFESFFSPSIIHQVGWALVHFLWEGAAAAGLLGIGLWGLRNSSARARYILSCMVLFIMAILPAGTLWVTWTLSGKTGWVKSLPPVGKMAVSLPPVLPNGHLQIPMEEIASLPLPSPSWYSRVITALEKNLPWIVAGWIIGVVILSVRLLASWLWTEGIKHNRNLAVSSYWQGKLANLARQIGVSRSVRLLESALTRIPIVIGHFRPLILLPASALTGLTPGQLEAILIHELSHIRRYDYLVNLVQAFIETLLFYHPAVWWVSRRIRIERENCCDDLAVNVSGDRVTYARALVAMEELRQSSAHLALAADGGSLLCRIQRLVDIPASGQSRSTRSFAGVLVLVMVISIIIGLKLPAFGSNKPQPTTASSVSLTPTTKKDKNVAKGKFELYRQIPVTVKSPAGNAVISKGRFFEGGFNMGKRIPLNIKPLKDKTGRELRFDWVEFQKSENKVWAVVHVDRSPDFQADWTFKIRVLDKSGKILGGSYPGFSSTDKNRQKELAEGKDLRLEFEPVKIPDAVKFRMEVNPPETRVYDVGDILESMQRTRQAGSRQEAQSKLMTIIKEKLKPNPEDSETLDFWREKWLIAYQLPKNHGRMEKILTDQRGSFGPPISLEIRFFSCSPEEENKVNRMVPGGVSTQVKPKVLLKVLSDRQVEDFLKGTQGITSGSVIQSPRIVVGNKEDFIVRVENQVSVKLPEIKKQKGSLFARKEYREIPLSLGPSVSGTVAVSPDRKAVHVEADIHMSIMKNKSGKADGISESQLGLKADIPANQTLLIRNPFMDKRLVGARKEPGHKEYDIVTEYVEGSPPIRYCYVMIKPKILVREEVRPSISPMKGDPRKDTVGQANRGTDKVSATAK